VAAVASAFGWIGQTRRQALADRLDTIVQAWWQAWALAPLPGKLRSDGESRLDGGQLIAEGRGRLALQVDGSLARALCAIDDEQAGTLSRHIGQAALADLATRIVGTPSISHGASLPLELTDERLGACCLFLDCAGVDGIVFRLDRVLVDRLAPAPITTPKTVPLAARKDIVGPLSVRVKASLDLGEVSLGELRDLRVGDVLSTSTALHRLIDVTVAASGKQLVRGQLGEQDGHRALLLETTSSLESMV
jgi:hypothetical protein